MSVYLGSVDRVNRASSVSQSYTERPCTTVLLVVQLQPAGGKHICLTDPEGVSS